MKNLVFNFAIIFSLSIILNSCSTSEFAVNKRRYNKGFYVDFKNKNIEKSTENLELNSKIEKQKVIIEIEKPTSNLSCSMDEKPEIINETNVVLQNNLNKNDKISVSQKEINKNKILEKIKFKNTDEPGNEAKLYALLSFIFGISGVVLITFFGLLLLIPALIFGILSLKEYKKTPEFTERKWMAIVGLSLGIAGILLFIIGVLALIYLLSLL